MKKAMGGGGSVMGVVRSAVKYGNDENSHNDLSCCYNHDRKRA